MFLKKFILFPWWKRGYALGNELSVQYFCSHVRESKSFSKIKIHFSIPKGKQKEKDDSSEENYEDQPLFQDIEKYKSIMKLEDFETLEKVKAQPKIKHLKLQDYSHLLRGLSNMDATLLSNEHLSQVIKFIGSSLYRKFIPDRTLFVLKKFLNELKSRSEIQDLLDNPVSVYEQYSQGSSCPSLEFQYNFLLKDVPNIILSCSNLNLYDQDFFSSFQKFIMHKDGELTHNSLEAKTLLALFWSYQRLNRSNYRLENVLLGSLDHKRETISHVNYLRLLWMLSLSHKDFDSGDINAIIQDFLGTMDYKSHYSYNAKNVFQIIQVCYSLYPELLNNIKYDQETGKATNVPMEYKLIVESLKKSNNPYLQHFQEMYRIFQKCQILANQKLSSQIYVNDQPKHLVYMESNSSESSYYVLKPHIEPPPSQFEKMVVETLTCMEDVKFYVGVKLGIYEIDIIIYPDVILELNGRTHFIADTDKEMMKNYKIKLE